MSIQISSKKIKSELFFLFKKNSKTKPFTFNRKTIYILVFIFLMIEENKMCYREKWRKKLFLFFQVCETKIISFQKYLFLWKEFYDTFIQHHLQHDTWYEYQLRIISKLFISCSSESYYFIFFLIQK